MPLYPNAERLIRGNFSVIKREKKPRRVTIGTLTTTQREAVNASRKERNFSLLSGEIFFIGLHIYKSRVLEDGYSEDDVIRMIQAAMAEDCVFVRTPKMTVLQSPTLRPNGYGCMIRDELILECSTTPPAELFSVVPRGDLHHKPHMQKGRP